LDTQIYTRINDDDAGPGPVEIFFSLNATSEINEKSINTGSGLRPGRDHILVAKVPDLWNKLRSSETKKNTRFFPLKLVEDKLADRVSESLESGDLRPGIGASDLLDTLI
jgi:hypothetical protein